MSDRSDIVEDLLDAADANLAGMSRAEIIDLLRRAALCIDVGLKMISIREHLQDGAVAAVPRSIHTATPRLATSKSLQFDAAKAAANRVHEKLPQARR
jgi:hypothetical protein